MIDVTRRQREILVLLAQGYTTDQIARRLFLSPSSVKTHVDKMFHRIGAVNRPHAVALFMVGGGFDDVLAALAASEREAS